MYPVEDLWTWKGMKPWSLHCCISRAMVDGDVSAQPITSIAGQNLSNVEWGFS